MSVVSINSELEHITEVLNTMYPFISAILISPIPRWQDSMTIGRVLESNLDLFRPNMILTAVDEKRFYVFNLRFSISFLLLPAVFFPWLPLRLEPMALSVSLAFAEPRITQMLSPISDLKRTLLFLIPFNILQLKHKINFSSSMETFVLFVTYNNEYTNFKNANWRIITDQIKTFLGKIHVMSNCNQLLFSRQKNKI